MTTNVKAQIQDAHSKGFKSRKSLKQSSEQRAAYDRVFFRESLQLGPSATVYMY